MQDFVFSIPQEHVRAIYDRLLNLSTQTEWKVMLERWLARRLNNELFREVTEDFTLPLFNQNLRLYHLETVRLQHLFSQQLKDTTELGALIRSVFDEDRRMEQASITPDIWWSYNEVVWKPNPARW